MRRREFKARQKYGIVVAKAHGKYRGRRAEFGCNNSVLQKAMDAYFLRHVTGEKVGSIANRFGLSRSTLYKKLRRYRPGEYEVLKMPRGSSAVGDYLNPNCNMTATDIAKKYKISRSTLYRDLNKRM